MRYVPFLGKRPVFTVLITTDVVEATACGLIASIAAFDISHQEVLDSNTPKFLNEAIDPCSLADSPKVNASVQLSSWLECAVNGMYKRQYAEGLIILIQEQGSIHTLRTRIGPTAMRNHSRKTSSSPSTTRITTSMAHGDSIQSSTRHWAWPLRLSSMAPSTPLVCPT